MNRYRFTWSEDISGYQTNSTEIEAENAEEAWEKFNEGDYDTDFGDQEITDSDRNGEADIELISGVEPRTQQDLEQIGNENTIDKIFIPIKESINDNSATWCIKCGKGGTFEWDICDNCFKALSSEERHKEQKLHDTKVAKLKAKNG